MALQPDGKILVTSGALLRYTSVGTLDRTFGNDGAVETRDLCTRAGCAVALDGEIVVAGYVEHGFAVRRYFRNGLPDAAIANGGTALARPDPDHPYAPSAIARQADGKLVVACERDIETGGGAVSDLWSSASCRTAQSMRISELMGVVLLKDGGGARRYRDPA